MLKGAHYVEFADTKEMLLVVTTGNVRNTLQDVKFSECLLFNYSNVGNPV